MMSSPRALQRRSQPQANSPVGQRETTHTRCDPLRAGPVVPGCRRRTCWPVPRLSPLTLASAAKIASLLGMVRGYEQIKVQNVHRCHEELTRLRESGAPDR
ncbi:hypothetical protein GCM10022232_42850 [Streptomyces plumbiresistens]|uniref:Uncharacterized protein n=1 Tax=Streptomyces plumbiresistens TaxID=511811 RepID=A0ABP7RNV3_9ACTN